LGSPWLYVKLYAAPKLADVLLLEVLDELVKIWKAEGWIDRWFFIRYEDPDKHLRFRVHFRSEDVFGKVVSMLSTALQKYIEEGSLHKVQYDTYERELERYGADCIEATEEIFHQNSEHVVQLLRLTWGDARENFRWQAALVLIDRFLEDFGLDLSEKWTFCQQNAAHFFQEFDLKKDQKIALDARFRELRPQAVVALAGQEAEFEVLRALLDSPQPAYEEAVQHIKKSKEKNGLQSYLSSGVHMCVNRIISDQQRFHELMLYDFLTRLYQSKLAQQRRSTPPQVL
jgi:lantibiotic biosynthesis protein